METRLTATRLRSELFNTLDQVVATGQAVEIRRPGGMVRIVRESPSGRLAALTPHPGVINGDPEDLPSLSWEQNWNPVP